MNNKPIHAVIIALALGYCTQANAEQRHIVVAASGGDYTTIQSALDAIQPTASDPYVIDVMPGTYPCAIQMKSYVHIRGAGAGVTTLQCASYDIGLTLNSVQDVDISGLTVVGRLNGIDVSGSTNVSIRNNSLEAAIYKFRGVQVVDSTAVSITNNDFGGLPLSTWGLVLRNSEVVANANRFTGNLTGITISGYAGDNGQYSVSNNVITNGRDGIAVWLVAQPTDTFRVTVARNTITDNQRDGVVTQGVGSVGTATFQGNVIANNGEHGIYATLGSAQMVIGNRITGNGESDILLESLGTAPFFNFNVYDTVTLSADAGPIHGRYNVTSTGADAPTQ